MIKQKRKKKFIKRALILAFCTLFVIALNGCNGEQKPSVTQTSQTNIENGENSKEQLYSFIIPQSLMKKDEVEQLIESFKNGTATFPYGTGGEQIYTDIYVNDDGTTTYVFNAEQMETYKSYLHQFITHDIAAYVKNVEFTDDLTEITLYVDGYDAYDLSDGLAKSMGLYQIMSGVAPDKWHAHIVVKDDVSGKVISEGDYPQSR